ncbi:SDR family oxidoreductase [Candidatus Poribacteria bacterium]|nr:SDR family oxidoreductase [Candidatus Poribacteria bacterium]
MIDLHGKVALVTAGSRGLGSEIVLQLAGFGADVAFTFLKEEASAESLKRRLEDMGRKSEGFQADAADYSRAHDVVGDVVKKLGGLHILVCNAGVARGATIWRMTEDDWDTPLNVSLKGAFNYIRAACHVFMNQRYGKVVCIGSINGLRGRIGTMSYNAAKAGLTGLVKTAAAELGQFNVNVNLVAPGFVETPSQAQTPELIRDLVLKECSIKRLGTPGDIAPVVAFLCTDAARHVTCQIVKVDAGQYL